jgi:hypothetical protein
MNAAAVMFAVEESAVHGPEADAVYRNRLDFAVNNMVLYENETDASFASLRNETPCAAFWKTFYGNDPIVLGGPEAYLAAAPGSVVVRYDNSPVQEFPTFSFGVKQTPGTYLMAWLSMDMRERVSRAMSGDFE